MLYGFKGFSFDEIYSNYVKYREAVRPFVRDTAVMLNDASERRKPILFEDAQGTMLDGDYVTYPFVTSSSATAGDACTGAGFVQRRF